MKITELPVEEFKRYVTRVKCINLFHYKLINDMKLREVGRVQRHQMESLDDIATLGEHKLVWYKDETGQSVYWNERNSRNILLSEQAESLRRSALQGSVAQIADSMRKGLEREVEIITVHDTVLDQKVIVDGVIRAVVLYYFYLQEQETLTKLLASEHPISSIEFISPAGALIFPCDFINICRDQTPQ